MRKIGSQPLRQVFDVRGRLKPVAANTKERQHWADAVDDEAHAASPQVMNVRERLSVDLRLLQCHGDLFPCRLLMTSKSSQDEPEVLEDVLAVEQHLDRWREIPVRRFYSSSYRQDLIGQPLRRWLALSHDAIVVRELHRYVVTFQDAGPSKPVGRVTPLRHGRTCRGGTSVRPDCERG